jgi:hypothetical protein
MELQVTGDPYMPWEIFCIEVLDKRKGWFEEPGTEDDCRIPKRIQEIQITLVGIYVRWPEEVGQAIVVG